MKTCDICHGEILKFHSWHDTGWSLTHLACEHHRSPADHAGYRWDGDGNLMIPKRKTHAPHTRPNRAKAVMK